jgi:hypothetical protein
VFDAFMPVFCVLTMEIFKSVIPCVTNEGLRVHGAAHEEGLVCLSRMLQILLIRTQYSISVPPSNFIWT